MKTIKDEIQELFIDTLGIEEKDLTPTSTNNDLQMDSLDKRVYK